MSWQTRGARVRAHLERASVHVQNTLERPHGASKMATVLCKQSGLFHKKNSASLRSLRFDFMKDGELRVIQQHFVGLRDAIERCVRSMRNLRTLNCAEHVSKAEPPLDKTWCNVISNTWSYVDVSVTNSQNFLLVRVSEHCHATTRARKTPSPYLAKVDTRRNCGGVPCV